MMYLHTLYIDKTSYNAPHVGEEVDVEGEVHMEDLHQRVVPDSWRHNECSV